MGGKAGVSLPLMDSLFKFSGQASSNAGVFKNEYNTQCTKLVQQGESLFIAASSNQTIRDKVYDVWLSCVSIRSKSSAKVFVIARAQGDDNSVYTLTIWPGSLPAQTLLRIYQISPSMVQCKYQGELVTDKTEFVAPSPTLECTKPADKALTIVVDTNNGTAEVAAAAQIVKDPMEALKQELALLRQDLTLPQGLVVAFGGSQCPAGWQEYAPAAGRAIIGVNTLTNGLSKWNLGDSGGEEKVKLTIDNMPAHDHAYNDVFFAESYGTISVTKSIGSAATDNDNKGFQIQRVTAPTGKDQPHNNMMPYIALTYCQKI